MRKMRVRGFTLVELIVVIAIIGVLAAILVPSMLGYVSKSKLSSANANAKSLYNAAMAACREADESVTIPNGIYASTDANTTCVPREPKIEELLFKYCDSIEGTAWAILLEDDCVVAACYQQTATDNYIGTYPNPTTEKLTPGTTAEMLEFAKNKTAW